MVTYEFGDMVADIQLAVNGFMEYLNSILRGFSYADTDEKVAVVSLFLGLFLLLVSVVLFIVL